MSFDKFWQIVKFISLMTKWETLRETFVLTQGFDYQFAGTRDVLSLKEARKEERIEVPIQTQVMIEDH